MTRNSGQAASTNVPCPDAPLTLDEAAPLIPGQPSVKTLYRWVTEGVRGIVLDSWFVGGRRFTSREAIDKFSAAITAARTGKRRPAISHEESRRLLKATHGI